MPTVNAHASEPLSADARTSVELATMSSATLGFVGLGIMGAAMSNNLLQAGFRIFGFDPSETAQSAFKTAGGHVCSNVATVAQQSDVIICSLPNADALMSAVVAIAGTGRKGLIVIETSTLDIDDKIAARNLLWETGVTLLDCPLSGTGAQAALKDLSVYSSGPQDVVASLQPVFDGFSKANYYLGEFGNGMRMKLMANLLVAIHNVSTAEVLLFGERMGIASELAVKVLADGAGGSRMLQVRGPVMAQRTWENAAMKVGVWQKDMRLIHAALEATNSPAPLFAATQPVYDAAMAAGHANHDTAAVFDVLEKMCGDAAEPDHQYQ